MARPKLEVVYRSEGLLVADKPSGLLVHRGWGQDAVTLADLVRRAMGPGAVHPVGRLDRGTSGLVLFALDPAVARAMSEALDDGRVEKRYLALVRGEPPEAGVVDHPLPRREDGPRVPARTRFRRLAFARAEPRDVSLVEAFPETGRPHQVRRHLKHAGHPVLGDSTYGRGDLNRAFRERYGLARLALHAAGLTLVDPTTGETLTLESPLPPDLAEPLAAIGLTAG